MSWLSSRQRSIFGTISCSSRIAWSTRASVEKPVLPRRFFDRPSFSNRISPSCCGEPMTNSSSASSPDVLLEAADLRRARGRRPRRRRSTLSLTPASSIPRSTCDERQLDLVEHAASGPTPRCARAASAASSRSSTASAAAGSSTVGGQRALLDELAQRERAARRLDQVRAEQRVVREVRRARRSSAFASCAMTGRSPTARDERLGPVALADRAPRRSVAAREAPAVVDRDELALGRLGRARRRARPARRAAASATSRSVASLTRALTVRSASGAGAAASSSPSASSRRRSGSRSSKSRKTSRRRAAVGRARRARRSRSSSTGTSRCAVASTFEIRASSAWFGQVLLALGAGDLVDVRRARPRGRRTAAAAARRSCRRSPGRRGCCPTCRP